MTMANKESKVNELYDKLKNGVQNFYSSESWKQYLALQSRFHSYSFKNVILILLQCPHATRVAGFNTWKEMGRYVKQGEKALKILAPSFIKVKDKTTGEEKRKIAGFHQTSVFDISQTDGKEVPSPVSELTMDTATLRAFYETVTAISPVPVEEMALKGDVKGYFMPGKIVVKKGMAALQKCKTLVHEMAHALLHENTDKERSLKEVEAEGTAFVVLSHFGFDTSEYSFAYVAGWNASVLADQIQMAGETIQKTAQSIIDEIEKEMAKKSAAA